MEAASDMELVTRFQQTGEARYMDELVRRHSRTDRNRVSGPEVYWVEGRANHDLANTNQCLLKLTVQCPVAGTNTYTRVEGQRLLAIVPQMVSCVD